MSSPPAALGSTQLPANLFNVWLNRRWLDSHISACIHFVVCHMSCVLWKTPLYTCERMRMEEEQIFNIIMKIVLTQTSWKDLRNPQGSPDHSLRTTTLISKPFHALHCKAYILGFKCEVHLIDMTVHILPKSLIIWPQSSELFYSLVHNPSALRCHWVLKALFKKSGTLVLALTSCVILGRSVVPSRSSIFTCQIDICLLHKMA